MRCIRCRPALASGRTRHTGPRRRPLSRCLKGTACLPRLCRKVPHRTSAYAPAAKRAATLRAALVLYPLHRNRMLSQKPPTAGACAYARIALAPWYNTPLERVHWRADDYRMAFLQNAKALPGAVSFHTLESVKHPVLENSMIICGNADYPPPGEIAIGRAADSLCFLHTYVTGKLAYLQSTTAYNGTRVGSYRVRYADGQLAEVPLVFGENITALSNYQYENIVPWLADAYCAGITAEGLPYQLFSYEWVNPRPDVPVESIEMLPDPSSDGELALLGLTCVTRADDVAKPALRSDVEAAYLGIWPLPNHIRQGEGQCDFLRGVSIMAEEHFASEAGLLRQGLVNLGIKEDGNITISIVQDLAFAPEGYCADIGPDAIQLAASSPAGMFYAVQSLLQLAGHHGCLPPCLRMEDAPLLSFRGVHLYIPPQQDLDYFLTLMEMLAKYRYNRLVLEIGAGLAFDSHPEINHAWTAFHREMRAWPGGPESNRWADEGMQVITGPVKNSVHIEVAGGGFITKQQAARIARRARELHMEVIPEVQSLSHAYWILLAHPECAECPEDPYPDTYCPEAPDTYKLLFDCMEEILEAFTPREVHIGHDELQRTCRCPRCQGQTGADWFSRDVLRLYEWLKARGVRTILWGDKLLDVYKLDRYEYGMAAGGAGYTLHDRRNMQNHVVQPVWPAVDMLPGDVALFDWYYAANTRDSMQPQDIFAQRGYEVIYGNLHIPDFTDLAPRLRRPNVTGAEVSSWNESSPEGLCATDALTRYLEAANMLWYGGYRTRHRAAYAEVVAALYPAERALLEGVLTTPTGAGRAVPLSDARPLPPCLMMCQGLVAAENAMGGIAFPQASDAALLVRNTYTLPLEGKAAVVSLLHAYTQNRGTPPLYGRTYTGLEQEHIGSYTFEYEDGSRMELPLWYAQQIGWPGRPYGVMAADPAFQRRRDVDTLRTLASGRQEQSWRLEGECLMRLAWRNPNPEKHLRALHITHEKPEGEIALFAVSLLP